MSDDKNQSLAIIPRTFDETRSLAEYLANASLVPVSARKQPHNALAMIMAGAEIGLAPMAALRAYHVIEGVPRLTADTMHAVCLKRPDLVAYMHPIEQAPERVVWEAKRRGEGAVAIRVTWDKARASQLPNFGKGPWRTGMLQMLNARAKAELARLVAPDVVGGLYALEEEIEAYEVPAAPNYTAPLAPPTAGATTPSGKANRTRKADPVAAAAPTAGPTDGPVDVTPPATTGVAQAARDDYAASSARVAAGDPEIVDAEIVDEQPAAHTAAASTPAAQVEAEPDDGFGEAPPAPVADEATRKMSEYLKRIAAIQPGDKASAELTAWRIEASKWGETQSDEIFGTLKTAYGRRRAELFPAAGQPTSSPSGTK